MPILSPAQPDVVAFVLEVMHRYHGELTAADLRVGVYMASPTEREMDKGIPCLRLHGYPCAATVEKTSYKQRVRGLPDAIITIDKIWWVGAGDQERTATIDHELEHVELCEDKDGQVKTDDLDRPKIKLRLHDLVVQGFKSIVDRHGHHAIEAQTLAEYFGEYKQKLMEWADDCAEQDQPADASFVGVR